jgi:hypothetical protein
LLLFQPVKHRLIRSDVTSIERLVYDKRGENRWVPNLVRMTEDAALPLFNGVPAGRRAAAGTARRQQAVAFSANCKLKLILQRISYLCAYDFSTDCFML